MGFASTLGTVECSVSRPLGGDVVLSDGGTAHVRPIRPADADRLRSFYSRLSDESIYFRFFGPRPRLSDRRSLVHQRRLRRPGGAHRHDRHRDGRGRPLRPDRAGTRPRWPSSSRTPTRAGASPRCCWSTWPRPPASAGSTGSSPTCCPPTSRMMAVFRQAGYTAQSRFEDGVVRMTLDLAPTETAREVTAAREHRAESRSIERLLSPGRSRSSARAASRAASARPSCATCSAPTSPAPSTPCTGAYGAVAGVRAYPSVSAIDGEVDLAVRRRTRRRACSRS